MSRPRPSIGRVVHYVAYGSPNGEYAPEHRAAIITYVGRELDEGNFEVCLCVLNPTGMFFSPILDQDEATKRSGTWHWPEYVPPIEDGE